MNLRSTGPGPRLAALALCGLLSASGCSDSEGGGEEAPDAELEASARAAAVNLQLTDLPEGYVALPAADDGGQRDNAALDACVENLDDVTVAEADSPTFGLQAGGAGVRFVASETSVLSDSAPAERLLSSVTEEPVLECLSRDLGEVLGSILPGAAAEAELTLAPDPGFPDLGAGSVHLTGSATFVRGDEAPVSFATSLVFVQTGDILSVVLFGSVAEPFPAETIRSLATTVAERQR